LALNSALIRFLKARLTETDYLSLGSLRFFSMLKCMMINNINYTILLSLTRRLRFLR